MDGIAWFFTGAWVLGAIGLVVIEPKGFRAILALEMALVTVLGICLGLFLMGMGWV